MIYTVKSMANVSELPCDGDGVCMVCKAKPSEEEKLTCKTCVTPWHLGCLKTRPETLASALQWECPDCTSISGGDSAPVAAPPAGVASDDLIAKIRAIEADVALTDREKAKKRQELMSGRACDDDEKKKKKTKKNKRKRGEEEEEDEDDDEDVKEGGDNDVLDLLDGSLNCSFCMQLPERPVTVRSFSHFYN